MLGLSLGERLDHWRETQHELVTSESESRFVRSIQRDKAAVLAGLTLLHRQGIGDRKSAYMKAHQAHGIWPGRVAEARASACSMPSRRAVP